MLLRHGCAATTAVEADRAGQAHQAMQKQMQLRGFEAKAVQSCSDIWLARANRSKPLVTPVRTQGGKTL